MTKPRKQPSKKPGKPQQRQASAQRQKAPQAPPEPKPEPPQHRPSLWERIAAVPEHPRISYVIAWGYFLFWALMGLKIHVMGDGEVESDFFGSYVPQARAFLDGSIMIDAFRGPIYPIILATFNVVLKPLKAGLFETGILLSAITAGVVLYLNHKLLKDLFGAYVALGGVLLMVLNPAFGKYSYTAGTDMVFTAIATLTMYIFLMAKDAPGWRRMVVLGALSAVAYLTRYNGLMLLLAIGFGLVVLNVWKLQWKVRIVSTLTMAVTFAVLITPWAMYCQAEKGEYFYNQNYWNVAFGFYTEGQQADHFRTENEDKIKGYKDVVTYDPRTFFAKLPGRAVTHFTQTMKYVMGWPAGALIMLGLVLLFFKPLTREQTAYMAFGFLFFAILWLIFYNHRFYLFLIPFFAVFALRAVTIVTGWLKGTPARVATAGLLVILCGYSSVYSYVVNSAELPGGQIEFRQMGEWLQANVPESQRGTKVVSRKPHFSYFAGLEFVPLPVLKNHDELLAYLYKREADYLMFSYVAESTRKDLGYLYGAIREHPGLRPIHAQATAEGNLVAILYRVLPKSEVQP